MDHQQQDQPLLELEHKVGFCGEIPSGLKVHPDRTHIVYSVGCTVVIENLNTHRQESLSGHTDSVSCLAISKSGEYLASGQCTHMGFKADIIIWNFKERKRHANLKLHMVKVEAMAFSPNDKYLVSLGGQDDGSVVVWNVSTGDAICGSPAQVMSAGMAHTLCYANNSDDVFVTGGNGTLRVWQLDVENRKIRPQEVNMGQLKRVIKCIEMAPEDDYFFCGTTTGDLLAINMRSYHFQTYGPEHKDKKFSLGVTTMALLKTGDIIVGAGDGTVSIVKGFNHKQPFQRTKKEVKLPSISAGAISSIGLRGEGHQFFVGTERGSIFKFNFSEFTAQLLNTNHAHPVNDICFPFGTGLLFLTCSYEDVRIWASNTGQEVLRITVPNMTCNAIEVLRDGKAILSGWDDGKIRLYSPESGKELYTIMDAHTGGVTALAAFDDCNHIVSGGKEGSVRMWKVEKVFHPVNRGSPYRFTSKMLFALKEHKASVTCIKLRKNNEECVTSSCDGSCIIWDLVNVCRLQMFRVNTLFQYVCYHPLEHQIIATGTDRKISYYESFDASCIRELEGSKAGAINCMDISTDGKYFVSGGDDKLVKLWGYDQGEVIFMGIGHSAPITRVKISPDEDYILSASKDGAILRWKFPLN